MKGGAQKRALLTLGPLLFHWSAEARRDFYLRIADEAPLDRVCLGEVVCPKRSGSFLADLGATVERLERGGKEVVLSTPALIMDRRDMGLAESLLADEARLVEANDVAVLGALAGRAHAIGPFLNVYNEGTLAFLARQGAVRLSLPAEIPASALAHLAAAAPGVELEMQAFGRVPLAISARCYHARVHGLHKDGCRYVCAEDPDGMPVRTLDGEDFLAINGPQILSHALLNLVREVAALNAGGVRAFRLWPHAIDMVAVAETFRETLDGRVEGAAAERRLGEIAGLARFANGFLHGAEGAAWIDSGSPA